MGEGGREGAGGRVWSGLELTAAAGCSERATVDALRFPEWIMGILPIPRRTPHGLASPMLLLLPLMPTALSFFVARTAPTGLRHDRRWVHRA